MTKFDKNSGDNAIEAEASAWLAQLDSGRQSSEDLVAFKEWMSRSPRHQSEIYEMARMWGDLNMLTELAGPIAEAHASERKLISNGFGRKTWSAVAAITVVALMATTLLTNLMATKDAQSALVMITTEIGQQETTTLTDGSVVTLNTNTQLEIDFSDSIRKIRLLNGEAIFDVVPNKQRPFVVYAGDGVVRAVGTIFSVHLDEDVVNVLVTEGAVELSAVPNNPQGGSEAVPSASLLSAGFIKSGHRATLESKRTQIEPVSVAELQTDLSWQDGLLVFSGEPLAEVVNEISRYTTMKITISDPEISSMRIGGVFPAGDMDTLFEALQLGFGVAVDRSNPNEVRLYHADNSQQ